MKQYTNVSSFPNETLLAGPGQNLPMIKATTKKKSPVSLGAEEQARLEQLKTLKFVA